MIVELLSAVFCEFIDISGALKTHQFRTGILVQIYTLYVCRSISRSFPIRRIAIQQYAMAHPV